MDLCAATIHDTHSIKLSVHGVHLHALFKATVQFRFLHWTNHNNGKNQTVQSETGQGLG